MYYYGTAKKLSLKRWGEGRKRGGKKMGRNSRVTKQRTASEGCSRYGDGKVSQTKSGREEGAGKTYEK